jgi:choline dehydrogenase-like flavoprotein
VRLSERAVVRESVEALAAALLPPELGGPRPHEVADAAAVLLRARPAPGVAGVAGVGLALRAAARLRHGCGIHDLDAHQRARLLQALERAGAPGVAALDGVKALLLLAWGAHSYAEEIGAVAGAWPPAREDGRLDLVDGTEMPARLSCDAVVVGSGAGGAFAARELARAGRQVLILEEGERWDVARLRATPGIVRFAGLYRGGGTTVALGTPPIVLPVGRAVGGTTVVNSGTCYRPPASVVEQWHAGHGLALAEPGPLAERLDEIEQLLGVAPVPLEVMGNNGRLALAGAEALGWDAAPLRRNAPGCRGACQCALGCPNNAKAGVHLTALPQACANGARIIQRLKVQRVVMQRGHAAGVQARDRGGRAVRVDAPLVVLSAGATETPPLLRRSGLAGHPRVGRGLSIHPSLAVVGVFEEPVTAWRGVLQSAGIERAHARHGVLIEATSTPPGMGSMMLPGVGGPLLRALDGAEHVATLGAMVADAPSGRVLGRSRSQVVYRLARQDGRRLLTAVDMMSRVLLAAGAREVQLGGEGPPVTAPGRLREAVAAIDVRRLHLAAFHPTGSCAGGADPARHPADPVGRLRGVDGVVIADASLLPSCPRVNPQLSIMAVAAGAAAAALR